jgi:hypothetical protein
MQVALGKTSCHSLKGRLVVTIQRLALVTAVDNLIEKIGRFVVEGKIADLVD